MIYELFIGWKQTEKLCEFNNLSCWLTRFCNKRIELIGNSCFVLIICGHKTYNHNCHSMNMIHLPIHLPIHLAEKNVLSFLVLFFLHDIQYHHHHVSFSNMPQCSFHRVHHQSNLVFQLVWWMWRVPWQVPWRVPCQVPWLWLNSLLFCLLPSWCCWSDRSRFSFRFKN